MPKSRRRYRKLFYVIVPLGAIVAALATLELGLRVFFPVPFAYEVNMYFDADPYVGYRYRPNSSWEFNGHIETAANRFGQRDRDTTLAKPAGTYRILLIGDSFTAGANVPDSLIYAQVLEDALNARSEHQVEVVNAGTGGWEPFQYAQYYEHYGQQFDPDMVLIGLFVGNDAYATMASVKDLPTAVLGRRFWNRSEADADSLGTRLTIWFYMHSDLVRLVMNRGRLVIPNDEKLYDAELKEPRDSDALPERYLAIQHDRLPNLRPPTARTRARLSNCVHQIVRIKELADAQHRQLVVVLIPDELQVNEALRKKLVHDPENLKRLDLDMPQKQLELMFKEAGIETLDPLPVIRTDPRRLYMNDTHLNPHGHDVLGHFIADAIGAAVTR